MSQFLNKVTHGDCLECLAAMPNGIAQLGFADPPYNIGFDYQGEYRDSMKPDAYIQWCEQWMAEIYRVLAADGTFWLVIGDEWVAELVVLAKRLGFTVRSWVVWYYAFGVNCESKFTRSHAHLLYFVKNREAFTFNADAVRVPSKRQMIYKDKRASPDGRLPDDTWILMPESVPDVFASTDSVWGIPRICGTHKQRVDGAANQLPELLVARVIRACSNVGDVVIDPMAGTGTTPAVAKKLGRQYVAIEQSAKFAAIASQRVASAEAGGVIDGTDQPTT